jgi:predicted nucleic acid-binding protein
MTKKRILLDTSILIGAFDHDPQNPKHVEARRKLRAWLGDETVDLVITPLVSYETLIKPTRISGEALTAKLKGFQSLPVGEEEARVAVALRHLVKDKGILLSENRYKHSFDCFHCACAQVHGLEIDSADEDIAKIKPLMQEASRSTQDNA